MQVCKFIYLPHGFINLQYTVNTIQLYKKEQELSTNAKSGLSREALLQHVPYCYFLFLIFFYELLQALSFTLISFLKPKSFFKEPTELNGLATQSL